MHPSVEDRQEVPLNLHPSGGQEAAGVYPDPLLIYPLSLKHRAILKVG